VEAGAVALSVVLLTKTTFVALFSPKSTVAPVTKFVPVIVMTVPPLAEATVGEIFVIVGLVEAQETWHISTAGTISAMRRAARGIAIEQEGLVFLNFIEYSLQKRTRYSRTGFSRCALGRPGIEDRHKSFL
jgi:hypothetical protein